MALTVATNTGSLMAQAAASGVNKEMETAMARLSTGKRLNSAADDAAGVAIASRLSSEIRGTNQAIRNAMDAQALLNTAEGAHAEVENILQRMRELAVQAANDTNGTSDRQNLQLEIDQLVTEIDRISAVTTWAGINLLQGTGSANTSKSLSFQIGAGDASSDSLSVSIDAIDASSLGLSGSAAVTAFGTATLSASGSIPSMVTDGTYEPSGNSGSFTISGGAGTIVFSGSFTQSQTITTTIAGEEVQLSLDSGTYALTPSGTAAAFAAAIATEMTSGSIDGVSATASGGTVTITQTATATSDPANGTVTFTDGFDTGDTFTMAVNGVSVSITVGADGYSDDAAGVAEQFGDKIKDTTALSAVNVSVSGGVVTLTQGGAVSVTSSASAIAALADIDAAIQTLNSQRAKLGANSNRLDSTVSNMTNVSNNLSAGKGRIEDADFAAETTALAKYQILQQASTAMLAQANAMKQNVLSLLQG